MSKDFLDEQTRAEDIILGGLGFGEDAKIVSIEIVNDRYIGTACWSDGEEFSFQSETEITELESWAVSILNESKANAVALA